MDNDVLNILAPAIVRTWSYVVFDVEEISDNEEAIELCIDADRLKFTGNSPEANNLIIELCKEYGPMAVISWLGKHVQLV